MILHGLLGIFANGQDLTMMYDLAACDVVMFMLMIFFLKCKSGERVLQM